MPTQVLGTTFDRRDQGQAMLYSAFGWLIYMVLVTIADINWPRDVSPALMISALARFGSIVAFVAAVLAFTRTMPESLKLPTWTTAALALLGGAIQLSGVFELMKRLPDLGDFTGTFLIAQLVYAVALFPFSYCLWKHPMFPRWLAVALAIDGLFWICYYIANITDFAYLFFEILAWGPSMLIEFAVGIFFVRVGITLSRMAQN